MSDVYIYGLRDPLTEEIRYVGKSNDPKKRFEFHMYCNDTNRHKKHWIMSLKRIGTKPDLVILEKTNEQDWEEREKHWIKYGRDNGWRLTNLSDGGLENLFYNEKVINKKLLYPYVYKENRKKLDGLSPEELFDLALEMAKQSVGLMKGFFTGKTDGFESYIVARNYINNELSHLKSL